MLRVKCWDTGLQSRTPSLTPAPKAYNSNTPSKYLGKHFLFGLRGLREVRAANSHIGQVSTAARVCLKADQLYLQSIQSKCHAKCGPGLQEICLQLQWGIHSHGTLYQRGHSNLQRDTNSFYSTCRKAGLTL